MGRVLPTLLCALSPLLLISMPLAAFRLIRRAYRVVETQAWLKLLPVVIVAFLLPIPVSLTISFLGLHGFIPLGSGLLVSTYLGVATAFLSAAIFGRHLYHLRREPGFPLRLYSFVMVGVVLVPFSFALPSLLFKEINAGCDTRNRETAEQIVKGVKSYVGELGEYPLAIEDLTPRYLAAIPPDHCDPFGLRVYWLEACPGGPFLLVIDTMTRIQFQRYNFATGIWSTTSEVDWLEVGENLCFGAD